MKSSILFLTLIVNLNLWAKDTLKLDWSISSKYSKETEYNIQISKDASFKRLIINEKTKKSYFEWKVSQPGKFYWRVINLVNNKKLYSKTGFINIKLKPTIIADQKFFKSKKDSKQVIRWKQCQACDGYYVKIIELGAPVVEKKVYTNSLQYQFDPEKQYQYQVKPFSKNIVAENASIKKIEFINKRKKGHYFSLKNGNISIEQSSTTTESSGDIASTFYGFDYQYKARRAKKFNYAYQLGYLTTYGESSGDITIEDFSQFNFAFMFSKKLYSLFEYGASLQAIEVIELTNNSDSISSTKSIEYFPTLFLSHDFDFKFHYELNLQPKIEILFNDFSSLSSYNLSFLLSQKTTKSYSLFLSGEMKTITFSDKDDLNSYKMSSSSLGIGASYKF